MAHWLFALFPFALLPCLFAKSARHAFSRLMSNTELRLAWCAVATMLGMIICAACFFGTKFDYIGLERYYLPVRPLYFLIFLTPLLLIPRRVVRTTLSLILLSCASWTIVQEWTPTYLRWVRANRPHTLSGAWSRTFEPDSGKLYAWLRVKSVETPMLVFSNFHEYLTLETGIAILPIPASVESLNQMCDRARQIRGVEEPLPIFVLNPENLWRDYWIAPPKQIERDFKLVPFDRAPADLRLYVFTPSDPPSPVVNYLTLTSWN